MNHKSRIGICFHADLVAVRHCVVVLQIDICHRGIMRFLLSEMIFAASLPLAMHCHCASSCYGYSFTDLGYI